MWVRSSVLCGLHSQCLINDDWNSFNLVVTNVYFLAALGWSSRIYWWKKQTMFSTLKQLSQVGRWPRKQWAMAPGGGAWGGNGIPSPVLIPRWDGSVGSFTPNCFKTEPHQLVWLPEPLGEWGLYELCICECPGRSSIHSLNIYCPTLRQALFQVLRTISE